MVSILCFVGHGLRKREDPPFFHPTLYDRGDFPRAADSIHFIKKGLQSYPSE